MGDAMIEPREERLLTTREVARVLAVSIGTVKNLRRSGEGPPVVKIGRAVRYPAGGLLAWIEGRTRAVREA